jgi:hypothetical protein
VKYEPVTDEDGNLTSSFIAALRGEQEEGTMQDKDKIHLTCLWISTGAYIGDKRPRSKSELRRALAAGGETVRFDVTAPAGSQRAGEIIPATAAGVGEDRLNVTGPDPESPGWWAIVQVGPDGKVVVA